jgi:2-amino-4-hydroxy-6-hydroxymethyldihydropteridine diphosphokinase
MQLHAVYLLFGSNLGDRMLHLKNAIQSVKDRIGDPEKISSVYETEPWGVTDQPGYLNTAMLINTHLQPAEILLRLKEIELSEGRISQKKYASRTLDIDILFYNDLIFNSDDLIIPHPKFQERKFALVPMNEIAGDLIHPVLKKSVSELLHECNDPLQVTKLEEHRSV